MEIYLRDCLEVMSRLIMAGDNKTEVNYEPSKLSGFTQVNGCKHISKKKRKQSNICK